MKNKILEVILTILKKILPSKWIKFIDGYKSIIGIIGFTVVILLDNFGVPIDANTQDILSQLFIALGIYGFADKLVKAKKSTDDLKQVIESIK